MGRRGRPRLSLSVVLFAGSTPTPASYLTSRAGLLTAGPAAADVIANVVCAVTTEASEVPVRADVNVAPAAAAETQPPPTLVFVFGLPPSPPPPPPTTYAALVVAFGGLFVPAPPLPV